MKEREIDGDFTENSYMGGEGGRNASIENRDFKSSKKERGKEHGGGAGGENHPTVIEPIAETLLQTTNIVRGEKLGSSRRKDDTGRELDLFKH